MGLTAKANEVSKEWSCAPDSLRRRKAEGDCFMQSMTANAELVVCHFSTKINKTCLYSVHAIFHKAMKSAGDNRGKGAEPARCTRAHWISLRNRDRCGYFSELSVYWRIWNVSHLRPLANNYYYSLQLQTPSKQRQSSNWAWCSNSSSSFKVCKEFNQPTCASCWTKMGWFCAHSFWTVVSSFLLYLAKDSSKPSLVRAGHARVSTVTLKGAMLFTSQGATFMSWDRWVCWEYLGKDDQKVSAQKKLKESTLAQCV